MSENNNNMLTSAEDGDAVPPLPQASSRATAGSNNGSPLNQRANTDVMLAEHHPHHSNNAATGSVGRGPGSPTSPSQRQGSSNSLANRRRSQRNQVDVDEDQPLLDNGEEVNMKRSKQGRSASADDKDDKDKEKLLRHFVVDGKAQPLSGSPLPTNKNRSGNGGDQRGNSREDPVDLDADDDDGSDAVPATAGETKQQPRTTGHFERGAEAGPGDEGGLGPRCNTYTAGIDEEVEVFHRRDDTYSAIDDMNFVPQGYRKKLIDKELLPKHQLIWEMSFEEWLTVDRSKLEGWKCSSRKPVRPENMDKSYFPPKRVVKVPAPGPSTTASAGGAPAPAAKKGSSPTPEPTNTKKENEPEEGKKLLVLPEAQGGGDDVPRERSASGAPSPLVTKTPKADGGVDGANKAPANPSASGSAATTPPPTPSAPGDAAPTAGRSRAEVLDVDNDETPPAEVTEESVDPATKIILWKGGVTDMEVDCVVNAANERCMGGGGVDGAIHDGAGNLLMRECATFPGCKTGHTRITKGYNLPARFVLHAVGPMGERPAELRSAYETCFRLAARHNCRTIGFCCISTGIFGYPLQNATVIAVQTALKVLRDVPELNDKFDAVVFACFRSDEYGCYKKVLTKAAEGEDLSTLIVAKTERSSLMGGYGGRPGSGPGERKRRKPADENDCCVIE